MSFLLLQNGTDKLFLQNGTDYLLLRDAGGGGAASRLTKYAQNIPHMHGNNRFIRIGR